MLKKLNQPRIAILLAAFNGEKFLYEQINSLLKQSKVLVRIFISVDLSSDGTLEIVYNLIKDYKNIELLPYGEKFGGAAKNFYRLIKDVDFSLYDYVALSDQDDIWLPRKLENGIVAMNITNSLAYSSDVIAFWSDGRSKYIKKSYSQKKYDYFFESAGPGCTYIFTVNSLTGFKNKIINNWQEVQAIEYHDWLIYSYFRENNLSWHIDSSSSIYYRQHQNNQLGANASIKSYCSRMGMITSGWYFEQIYLISKILNLNFPSKYFVMKNILSIRRNVFQSLILGVIFLIKK